MSFKLDLNLENYFWESRCCMGCAMCKYGDWIYAPGIAPKSKRFIHDFTWVCPEWQWGKFDNWGATGRTRLINALFVGDLPWDEPLIHEAAFRCFSCGACDVGCKRNLDLEILLMNQSLKVALVERGFARPEHKGIIARIEKSGNYYGMDQKIRKNWVTDDIKVEDKADVLFFVGCWASYKYPEVAQATARILNKAGVPFMLLDEERCCGSLMYETGHVREFRIAARATLEKIRQSGAKTVVCACGYCYKTIKVEYPKVLDMATSDLGFEVLHIAEFADKLREEGKITPKEELKMKVTYHDACSVGRLSEPWIPWEGIRDAEDWGKLKPARQFRRGTNGCYEPPRNLIKAIPGIELVEMFRHHHNAYHSGEGGGVLEAYPETAHFAADWRLREADEFGAEAIVTPDVHSLHMLRGALERVETDTVGKVYHIAEIVDQTYSG